MGIFEILLILAALLCSLVAGFVFAYAIVVMPGIGTLNDREFLRSFQVMDRVIQHNQPVFMVVWVGSVLVLVAAAVLGVVQLEGAARVVLVIATLAYVFGVQLPTVRINVPLNNKLQTLDVDALDETARRTAREQFEPRWNLWNLIRTVISSAVSAILMVLLWRL